MRIVNLDSLNIDKVYQVDHFAAVQETISAGTCRIYPGGKGLNQSAAIARAGREVSHLMVAGN